MAQLCSCMCSKIQLSASHANVPILVPLLQVTLWCYHLLPWFQSPWVALSILIEYSQSARPYISSGVQKWIINSPCPHGDPRPISPMLLHCPPVYAPPTKSYPTLKTQPKFPLTQRPLSYSEPHSKLLPLLKLVPQISLGFMKCMSSPWLDLSLPWMETILRTF